MTPLEKNINCMHPFQHILIPEFLCELTDVALLFLVLLSSHLLATRIINKTSSRILLTMSLDPSAIQLIIARQKQDLQSYASSADPYVQSISLRRVQTDLPHLLRALNGHKNSKNYEYTHAKLNELSALIDEILFKNQKALEADLARKRYEYPPQTDPKGQSTSELVEKDDPRNDLTSLRKRLLADGTSTSLIDDKRAEQGNEYHETMQENILKDLTSLATDLKSAALSLSSKITEDTKVVDETGERMLKNLSLMQTVGTNLNGYLVGKTGGKISLFFLLKTSLLVLFVFVIALVLINFLPKM